MNLSGGTICVGLYNIMSLREKVLH